MMGNLRKFAALASLSAVSWVLTVGSSAAQSTDWQLNLQPPASLSAVAIVEFHDLLLWIITAITLFVLGEKLLPRGEWLARVNGAAMAAFGGLVLFF